MILALTIEISFHEGLRVGIQNRSRYGLTEMGDQYAA